MENQIETIEQLEQLVKTETGLAVYFYSNKCAPCISLRPKVLQMIQDNFPQMKLVFVDSEKSPEIPAAHGVFANPGIIIFFQASEYRRYSKYISIDQLGGEIERVYNMVF